MIGFLFWNLNKKPLQNLIANLASRYEVDVLMLVECSIPPAALLETLNRRDSSQYHYVPQLGCEEIEIFTRFPSQFIKPISEADRFTIRHLALPGVPDILLAVTHVHSKLYANDIDQLVESQSLATSIEVAEDSVGHSRTALVGDLNMNPFEDGVASATGLHGVMCRSIAERKSRVIQGKEYRFFYNPMWSLFGDGSPGPPGTYYYDKGGHKVYFWNMFDQVLIRPDLLGRFQLDRLRILESDGELSLLSPSGVPDTNIASDHLPISFGLAL